MSEKKEGVFSQGDVVYAIAASARTGKFGIAVKQGVVLGRTFVEVAESASSKPKKAVTEIHIQQVVFSVPGESNSAKYTNSVFHRQYVFHTAEAAEAAIAVLNGTSGQHTANLVQ